MDKKEYKLASKNFKQKISEALSGRLFLPATTT